MEVLDGVVQRAGVELGQHHLEIAERLTRAAHDLKIIAAVERHRRHVVAQPPEAVCVHQVVVPFLRVVKVQALHRGEVGVDVLGDLVDVAHQLQRALKGVGVHPLHQIRLDLGHAGAVVADVVDLVGVVHVAHLDLLIGEKRAGNAERFAHLEQLVGDVGIHGLGKVGHGNSSFRGRARANGAPEITVLGRRYTGDAAHRQFGISKVRRIECAAHRQYGVLEMQCIARLNRFYSMRPRTQKAPRIARSFRAMGASYSFIIGRASGCGAGVRAILLSELQHVCEPACVFREALGRTIAVENRRKTAEAIVGFSPTDSFV